MVSIVADTRPRRRVLTAIAVGGLTAGVLDFSIACLESGAPPLTIGKAVARGWFGKAAMHGGTDVALIGIVSHFAIMLAFAATFVLISLRAPILRRLFFVTGPLYGAAIFFFMRFVVLPVSAAGFSMPKPPVLYIEFAGHLFLVGLVIAGVARGFLGRD
ncbi:MAG TPA: hypothetical protein VGH86_12175 [Phenylobacterium sp.]|jgi:uncharacterized membrane protein YagU involved in acid resistance